VNVVKCAVCARPTPEVFAQEHHPVPQAAGGTDMGTVPLCASCHANIHSIATMLQGPRASMAEDTVRTFYANNTAGVQACLKLAGEAARWMTLKKTGQLKPVQAHEDVELIVTVPAAVKRALILLGRDARDPATQKRLGLAGAVRAILIRYVVDKFPALKQEIQASQQQVQKNPEPSRATKQALARESVARKPPQR